MVDLVVSELVATFNAEALLLSLQFLANLWWDLLSFSWPRFLFEGLVHNGPWGLARVQQSSTNFGVSELNEGRAGLVLWVHAVDNELLFFPSCAVLIFLIC